MSTLSLSLCDATSEHFSCPNLPLPWFFCWLLLCFTSQLHHHHLPLIFCWPRLSRKDAWAWPKYNAPQWVLCEPHWAPLCVAWTFVGSSVGFFCTEETTMWEWNTRCHCCTGEVCGPNRSVTWFVTGIFFTLRIFASQIWCLSGAGIDARHDWLRCMCLSLTA